jgi:hypothetical protein
LISDSALKVVFLTTLYVDVKEPAVRYSLSTKKLNLVPTKITALAAIAGFRFRCRDKIEPNLQSQNVRRTLPKLMESRFQRDQQSIANRRLVNAIRQIYAIFCPAAIPLHPERYLFASGWVLTLQGAECKIRGEPKRKYRPEMFRYSVA